MKSKNEKLCMKKLVISVDFNLLPNVLKILLNDFNHVQIHVEFIK